MQSFHPVIPAIIELARNSPVASYSWKGRGKAPIGYVNGMAVMFARVLCNLHRFGLAAREMAKADTGQTATDALAHFRSEFKALGMDNSQAGETTLRHLFVLMFGLGMRESSGDCYAGQGGNTGSDTAEAGLFQTSYNSHTRNPELDNLFRYYKGKTDFIDIFKEGVSIGAGDLKNWGSGTGKEFQHLTKACPAFAVEYAAIVLRNDRQYSAPVNLKKVELRRDCDDLLAQVQSLIGRREQFASLAI